MKNSKTQLKVALNIYKDACISAGQSGIISTGIADEIIETQSNDTIFWLIENLLHKVEITDLDHLKFMVEFFASKISRDLDDFTNHEPDHIKASALSRIDFIAPANQLNRVV